MTEEEIQRRAEACYDQLAQVCGNEDIERIADAIREAVKASLGEGMNRCSRCGGTGIVRTEPSGATLYCGCEAGQRWEYRAEKITTIHGVGREQARFDTAVAVLQALVKREGDSNRIGLVERAVGVADVLLAQLEKV